MTHDGSSIVKWEAKKDASVPGAASDNMVMAVTENGSPYDFGHHCWFDGIQFTDGTLEVDMAAHDGKKGHMGSGPAHIKLLAL